MSGRFTIGIGIDIVGLSRFAATLERTPALAERLFTPAERGLALQSLAGRFAAKEALAKALGAPPGLRWLDAQVQRRAGGQPVFHLSGTVAQYCQELAVAKVHLSISHDADLATAMVLVEGHAP